MLKTPPVWEDQRAVSRGRATSASLSPRMPAFACVPGLEAGGHCVLRARAPKLLGDGARMVTRGSRLRQTQAALPPTPTPTPPRLPARPARPAPGTTYSGGHPLARQQKRKGKRERKALKSFINVNWYDMNIFVLFIFHSGIIDIHCSEGFTTKFQCGYFLHPYSQAPLYPLPSPSISIGRCHGLRSCLF